MLKLVFNILVVSLALICTSAGIVYSDIWVKGNTHTHTTLSDGDVSPEDAVKWYKNHGYQFLVLTDHYAVAPDDFFTSISDSSFVAIPGTEMHLMVNLGKFAVHCNSIGMGITTPPQEYKDISKSLVSLQKATEKAGTVFQVNHPSFHVLDTTAITNVTGPALVEIYNHGTINSQFGMLATSAFEQCYDEGLSAGRKLFCVASDDTHHYNGSPDHPPGGGFIFVRVKKLARQDILDSIRAGRFYASTGVEFAHCSNTGKNITVKVKQSAGQQYTIKFIGYEGKLLDERKGSSATYRLRGGKSETYVRVKVVSSSGKFAWSQPFWRK
jgi:hypothetical protein